jgi:nucleoside-diphosphate-sugar epimerase
MLPWILAQRIRQGQPVELAPGPQGQDGGLHVSFIYVDDLAQRLLWLAKAALEGLSLPPVLNLAGPEEVSLKKISEVLGSYLGNSPVFSYLSTPRCGDLKADIRLLDSLCPLTYTKLNDGLRALCAHMEDPSRTGSQ